MHKHISANINDLKNLWHTVFGDAPSVIDTYFNIFYSPELTAAEFIDGKLAAAAYVMPAGDLVNADSREKCAHIYAVAVYPEYRGRGLGVSVTNRAVKLAKDAGCSAVILHPANESLFGYYEKHCGFQTCFYASKNTLPTDASEVPEADIVTYMSVRERFLENIPHVALSYDILDFFTKCGGKLYASENGCAAVEIYDETSYFREVLGNSSPLGSIPTGMIHGSAPFKNGWMGLTLE
ncbi:MAG: GNAT family N-acetyltransferase [Oscillospiraceae bacterium]|nr:GNAT family N-acetyltransferase [Oscillospiraceae bacterium]